MPNGSKVIDGHWASVATCAEIMLPRENENSDFISYSARIVELDKESYISVMETITKILKPNKEA